MQKKKTIREVLQSRKLLCDGAFGTYYATKYDTRQLPELANIQHPERVRQIHDEYIVAGAEIIRTNTYACNTAMLLKETEEVKEYIRGGYRIACEAAKEAGKEKKNQSKKVIYTDSYAYDLTSIFIFSIMAK